LLADRGPGIPGGLASCAPPSRWGRARSW